MILPPKANKSYGQQSCSSKKQDVRGKKEATRVSMGGHGGKGSKAHWPKSRY